MHSLATLLLVSFSASVSADSMVVLNPWGTAVKTLTVKSSNPSATVLENVCSGGSAASTKAAASSQPTASGSSPSQVSSGSAQGGGTLKMTQITAIPSNFPMPTGAKMHRRDDSSDILDFGNACRPFTITQGASTWEFHMSANDIGSIGMGCKFGQGGFTSAEADCSASATGPATAVFSSSTSEKVQPSDWQSLSAVQTVNLVTSSGSAAPSGSGSPSGSTNGSATAGTKSQALAGSLSVPTAAVALAAGAGGIFAAALAL